MNDTQQKLYELLIKFDKLCQDNGVVYFLGGGSALGALRHKGFLPWDDDVDLYISRDNYDKLIANKDKFFDDEFILVNTDEYPRYRNTIVRMVDTNSTVITKARIVDGSPKGQFLELFIMDPIPKDKNEQEIWFKKQWVYTELLSTTFRTANPRICDRVDEKLYMQYKERVDKEGYDNILKELSDELFVIPESEADQYCVRWGMRNLIYNIEWLQEARYVPFEDIELPVANCAESVLRFDYGDSWMYVPLTEDQITHSFANIMNVPYKKVTDYYEQNIDAEALYNLYYQRKAALMETYFIKRKISNELFPFKQAQVECSIELNSKKYPNIREQYLSAQFDVVRDFFKTYYEIQFSEPNWKWNQFLKISDEHLCMALTPLLVDGDFSKVKRVLAMREKQGELSPELKILKDFAFAITRIYSYIDYCCFDKAKCELDEIEKTGFLFYDIQYNVRILKMKFELDCCEGDELTALANKFQDFLRQYNNPEIKYLIAETYFKKSDYSNAEKWYNDSKKTLRHGFVIRHLNDRLRAIEEGNYE